MTIPTISRYAESVSQPFGLFRTLNNLICERDVYGDPVLIAGGNAAVFKIWSAGKPYALKCYTKQKRPGAIYNRLMSVESSLLFKTKYLPSEIYVYGMKGEGEWYDAMLSEWAEGTTLEYEIRKALHYASGDMFSTLARSFDEMALELLPQIWAHGDLKPGNISVDDKGKMKLFDYDAMYFPDTGIETACETGTPQYQHPLRNEGCFDKYIDDYSVALISATLHSLAAMPDAAARYGQKDTFLFHPSDILARKSKGLEAMKHNAAQQGKAYLYRLLAMLESPSPVIEGLAQLISFGSRTNYEECGGAKPDPFFAGRAWGYVSEDMIIIPPMYDNALCFSDGLAIVEMGGYRHFIDSSGRTAINCSSYEQVKPFSHGAAAVCRDGLWGYIDTKGRFLVKPQYGSAETFRDGEAAATTKTGRRRTLKAGDLFK